MLEEACQIYGYLEVNRVRRATANYKPFLFVILIKHFKMGGSFHLAPGKSFSLNHVHIHDVHPYMSSSFNTSHTVKHLSFGERINYANTHPLDETEVNTKDGKFYLFVFIFLIAIIYTSFLFVCRTPWETHSI